MLIFSIFIQTLLLYVHRTSIFFPWRHNIIKKSVRLATAAALVFTSLLRFSPDIFSCCRFVSSFGCFRSASKQNTLSARRRHCLSVRLSGFNIFHLSRSIVFTHTLSLLPRTTSLLVYSDYIFFSLVHAALHFYFVACEMRMPSHQLNENKLHTWIELTLVAAAPLLRHGVFSLRTDSSYFRRLERILKCVTLTALQRSMVVCFGRKNDNGMNAKQY